MGRAYTDDDREPASARITLGDFCFFGGRACRKLVEQAEEMILVPQGTEWSALIQEVWGARAVRHMRYSIQYEPEVFCRSYLKELAAACPSEYELVSIGAEEYKAAGREEWSKDLRGCFRDFDDYERRGLGVAAVRRKDRLLAAGASSYSICEGGIEIEIDTREEFRRQGLALACGASLILECLNRGIYPGWDAHDLRSVAVAERLGYHRSKPYETWLLQGKMV